MVLRTCHPPVRSPRTRCAEDLPGPHQLRDVAPRRVLDVLRLRRPEVVDRHALIYVLRFRSHPHLLLLCHLIGVLLRPRDPQFTAADSRQQGWPATLKRKGLVENGCPIASNGETRLENKRVAPSQCNLFSEARHLTDPTVCHQQQLAVGFLSLD